MLKGEAPALAQGSEPAFWAATAPSLSLVEHIDDLGEVREAAGEPIDLVNQDDVDLARRDIGEQSHQSGALHVTAREPAIVVALGIERPAFMTLAQRIGSTGLILRIKAIKFL